MNWLYVVGIILFLLGLMVSIALHEIGHLVPAKIFGVKVTQYMVGFGSTAWSRRKGETEYGIKWIPFGGYIRMIGMLPPRPGDEPGKLRSTATGPWQGLIESARDAAQEEVRPGDEDRVFYRKKWWQKVIIMSGGPAMNFVLAFIFFTILLVGIGLPTWAPIVSPDTNTCVIPISEQRTQCKATDKPTPAAQAGMKPGDRMVSFNGERIGSWEDATRLIRSHGPGPVKVGIVRDGKPMTLNVTLIAQDRPNLENPEKIDKNVGFLGVLPTEVMEQQSIGQVIGYMGELTGRVAGSLINLPEKMVGVWHAAFSGEERDPEGPVGVVGAGRMGGEILASDLSTEKKVAIFVNLLAGFNLAIGMFNLIPLLPLDGGHIAGGLWEGIKRGFARIMRRPEPAYVDIAKVLPLTYAIAIVMMIMAGLLVYADLVNPLTLTN
ncbi:Membrane-associated zinc metalloprotease [[Actinomadura] parvosata subsp. kistnae]|uniref:Zinc metalloprotease n=1 Tax=[Actinomadura] parvosata subsp. kistnae TaxID=1909395 RepID=A0A1V0AHS0_9ACTN|nr:M50 family metallopeptidase [Nonomuraea sp. ATCC 55076]AQZ69733.1 zinc metalloprotease [Nonomuraea sp. ATCC 55076]SPL91540.1 Membrane-associated zinc metalloprotease [Actinomadura parvosata subsp. kistnae]